MLLQRCAGASIVREDTKILEVTLTLFGLARFGNDSRILRVAAAALHSFHITKILELNRHVAQLYFEQCTSMHDAAMPLCPWPGGHLPPRVTVEQGLLWCIHLLLSVQAPSATYSNCDAVSINSIEFPLGCCHDLCSLRVELN